MQPLITDRRHFFLLEGSNVPIDNIVERFCENGYHKTQSGENDAIHYLLKDEGVVSLYEMRETGDCQQVGGTIVPEANKLSRARKVDRIGINLGILFIFYCIVAIALYILPIIATVVGWQDFINLAGPITPFLGIGFLVFATILLIPLTYSTWILPVRNSKIAKNVLEDLVRIIQDTYSNVDLQSTEIKRQNWPDFSISHGIPEEILLKFQIIENAVPEFGNLEMQLNSVKVPF